MRAKLTNGTQNLNPLATTTAPSKVAILAPSGGPQCLHFTHYDVIGRSAVLRFSLDSRQSRQPIVILYMLTHFVAHDNS